MNFKQYGTEGGPKICPTLRAMLTETGEHMFRLAFDCQAETTRNFIFGVVVTRDKLAQEDCKWNCLESSRLCVYLCYELCDFFPLHENGKEYCQLQQAVERILEVRVRLLPFTQFERSIGIYPALCKIFRDDEFSGIFRQNDDSLFDIKMHVVLSRWEKKPFLSSPEPPPTPGGVVETQHKIPRYEWNTCFQSIARVLWYHTYVYEVIGVEICDGLSESNAIRTYEAVRAINDKDMRGKLALLDVLKLVYHSNYTAT